MIRYTTAPEVYDGFGTKTLEIVGENRKGQPVRKVEIDPEHLNWQCMRYASGLHMVADDQELAKQLEYGFVKAS